MTVDVVNSQNEKVGSLDLRDEVFVGRIKTDLIHESVVRANAAERRGTHATKTRAMVSGSGKKPWRQKGSGRDAAPAWYRRPQGAAGGREAGRQAVAVGAEHRGCARAAEQPGECPRR